MVATLLPPVASSLPRSLDGLAKVLGFAGWRDGLAAIHAPAGPGWLEKALAPPSSTGSQGTPGPNPAPFAHAGAGNSTPQGGHWVTIHHHPVFIDGNGSLHFGGPSSPAVSPHHAQFATDTKTAMLAHSAPSVAKIPHLTNAHTVAHVLVSGSQGIHVNMHLTGGGWRLELKDHTGATLGSQRVASMKKQVATDAAVDMLAAHHAAALQAAAAALPKAAPSTPPTSSAVPTSAQLTSYFGTLQPTTIRANTYTLLNPATGNQAVYRATGSGWHIQVHDAAGNTVGAVHRIPAQGGQGTHYARQVAAMALYAHEHGATIPLPSTLATGAQSAQIAAAHAHAGLAGAANPGTNTPPIPANPSPAPPVASVPMTAPAASAAAASMRVSQFVAHTALPSVPHGSTAPGWSALPNRATNGSAAVFQQNATTGQRIVLDAQGRNVVLEAANGQSLFHTPTWAHLTYQDAANALAHWHAVNHAPAPPPVPPATVVPSAPVAARATKPFQITSTHLRGASTWRTPTGWVIANHVSRYGGNTPHAHNANALYSITSLGTGVTVSVGRVGTTSHAVQVHDANGTLVGQHVHAGKLFGTLASSARRVANWLDVQPNGLPPVALASRARQPRKNPTAQHPTPATPNVPKDGQDGGGGAYVPPAPKLVQLTPFSQWRHGGGTGTTPAHAAQIDSSVVSASPNTLAAVFTHTDTSSTATQPMDLLHQIQTPSGLTVNARIAPTPSGGQIPAAGAHYYEITVHDKAGNRVSDYVQRNGATARSSQYIKDRAAQVANHAEQTQVAIDQHAKAGGFKGVQQFAAYYATNNAATGTSRTAPFSLDDRTFLAPATKHAIAGHLGQEFPAMVGAQQNNPHNGLDPVQHTLNVVANVETYGGALPQRDKELLRLAMVYHDVGKGDARQVAKGNNPATDSNHPRWSEEMTRDLLWQHGLSTAEHQDVRRMIKWHDAFGEGSKYLTGGASMAQQDVQRIADLAQNDERQAKLLMHAWQADVAAIPGLSHVKVGTDGPRYLKQVTDEIARRKLVGQAPPVDDVKVMNRPGVLGTQPVAPPNLVPKDVKYGELVQKTKDFHVGPQVPFGSVVKPPQEVYDEAKRHPDLNFARAMNMAYDGPTGDIITAFHGVKQGHNVQPIHQTGLRPGGTNSYGKGVYMITGGAQAQQSGYGGSHVIAAEVHTGRTIDHDALVTGGYIQSWAQAKPHDAAHMYGENAKAAAALHHGYHTITFNYSGKPAIVVLDPARIRIRSIAVGGAAYRGANVAGHQHRNLTQDEINGTGGPVAVGTSHGKPKLFTGQARTQ